LGVWQCFDSDEQKMDTGDPPVSAVRVDTGKEPVDPTIVNESSLLKAEDSPAAAEPQTTGTVDDGPSIAEAGGHLDADTGNEPDRFPLYAVAYQFHTQIKEAPDRASGVLAYARRGATFRVSERVSKKDCSRGWHEVAGGGFVCDGAGVHVGREPVSYEPAPPPPALNEPLPYSYRYTKRDGVVEYWKIPSAEEIAAAQAVLDAIDRRDAAAAPAPESPPAEPDAASDPAYDEAALKQVMAAALTAENEAPPSPADDAPAPAADRDGATPVAQDSGPTDLPAADSDIADPFALPPYVHMRMAKGYYVSTVDRIRAEDGTDFFKTVRGRYVNADELYPATASTFEGRLIGGKTQLPLVFVVGSGSKSLHREKADGPLKSAEALNRYDVFPLLGELQKGNATYLQIGDNRFVNSRVAAVAAMVDPPADLAENERWIHVDLKQQVLVAYEGPTPVFATLVATGKRDFETPTGEFRIYNKHVTITMDDPEAGDEAYSIEDVPWTQYFKEGYALHAAFWHDRFGRVRSHGCINLSPTDARRLFFWTGPHVPAGNHGVISTAANPGTRIVITG